MGNEVLDQVMPLLDMLGCQMGLAQLSSGNLVMIAVGAAMIGLAAARRHEPLLLVGKTGPNFSAVPAGFCSLLWALTDRGALRL